MDSPGARYLLAVLWLYSVLHFAHGAFAYQGYGDFFLILDSVRKWMRTGEFWADFGAYPPLHSLLMVPLAPLSDAAVAGVMKAANLIFLAVVVVVAAREVPARARRPWLLVAGPVLLNFRPLLYTLSMIKIEMLELVLVVLALAAFRRGREGVCGGLLACGFLVKFIPGVLVGYFLWKRRWRVVWGAAATGAALLLVTIGVFGVDAHVQYARHVVTDAFPLPWVDNQSWTGAMLRWCGSFPPASAFPPAPEGAAVRVAIVAGKLAFLGLLLRVSTARIERSRRSFDYETAVWLVGAAVLSGFFRDYYAVYFLPAYFFLVRSLVDPGQRLDRVSVGLALGSYMLIAQGFPLGLVTRLPQIAAGVSNLELFLYFSIPFVGYVALLAALVRQVLLILQGAGTKASALSGEAVPS